MTQRKHNLVVRQQHCLHQLKTQNETRNKFPPSRWIHLSLDERNNSYIQPHILTLKQLSQLETGSEEDLSSVLILTLALWSQKDLQ